MVLLIDLFKPFDKGANLVGNQLLNFFQVGHLSFYFFSPGTDKACNGFFQLFDFLFDSDCRTGYS